MRLFAALLAVMLAGCGGCASVPTHDDLKPANHRLTFEGGSVCSGTAVGPDLIITAKHCGRLLKVGDAEVSADVAESGKRDLVVLRVRGIVFDKYVKRGPQPKQGDRVRWWGNPIGERDVYRQGYVARVSDDMLVIAAQVCRGDSGAGLFDDLGRVVGIVSAMTETQHCQFALSFP